MLFDESYGDLTRPLLAAIRKYNVSPSDYRDLEVAYGEGHYSAIHNAIQRFSINGSFSVFEMWNRI